MAKDNVLVVLSIFVVSKDLEKVARSLSQLSEVVDLYEVTGEYDIVALVSSENIFTFREFLKNKVLKIPGVRSTVTSMVLFTHKKDGKIAGT